MKMKKFLETAVLSLLMGFVLCSPAWATKYAIWDSEDQTCGAKLPGGPPWGTFFEYRRMSTFCDVPGTPSGRKSYGVKYDKSAYGENVINFLNKTNGYANTAGSLPITCNLGKTYYMAVRFRVDRINGKNVFHSAGQSANKFLEIDGSGIRWLVSIGHWTGQSLTPGHFSIWGGNPTYHLNPEIEENSATPPNVNGYSWSNQPQLAYEKWHTIVAAVKVATDHSGSWQLWWNGVKIQEYNNIQTSASSSPSITRLLHVGTVAQPAYDAPPHYIYFDDLMMTDNWQDIIDGGYMGASAPPTTPTDLPPAAPGNLRITEAN